MKKDTKTKWPNGSIGAKEELRLRTSNIEDLDGEGSVVVGFPHPVEENQGKIFKDSLEQDRI